MSRARRSKPDGAPARLRRLLRQVERDSRSGSIELAHKSIMALFKVRRAAADPEKLDRQWLSWARRARPEMKVFANLAREALRRPGREAWARNRSLPFWLVTVLYNSVSRTVKAGSALIGPRDRVLIFSHSSTLVHAITMAQSRDPRIFAPKDPASQRTARLLRKEGVHVTAVPLNGELDATKVLVSCDAYDSRGAVVNARGTRRVVEWAARRKIPAFCLATWLKRSAGPLTTPRNRGFERIPPGAGLKLVGDL
jgi:translation initiation factor 2B subunit (eIF-2B alpha/beta/delta family)